MRTILAIILGVLVCQVGYAQRIITKGATDQTVYLSIIDSATGVPETAVAYDTASLDLEYVRAGAAATDITEATQTAAGAHSDGGFVHVGHGRYRLDLPDAAVATGVDSVEIIGTVTDMIVIAETIQLSPGVNVAAWNGTTVASPATAGYPAVTIKDGTGTGELDTASGKVIVDGAGSTGLLTAANIQSECEDALGVYFGTTTRSEPTGVPGDTPTILAMIQELYATMNYKSEQTATEFVQYRADGTTVRYERTTSDDGTTYSKGEARAAN